MTERNSESSCARANELVAFLYQEISEREALDFELHLRNCAKCSTDLVEFRQMRQSIGAWRDECLGVVSPGVVRRSVEVSNVFEPVPEVNRSAIGAIRQFLAFSPVWMKGAVAFASVLFCVIAALAVQHLFEKSQPAMVATEKLYTERELKAKIDEHMQALEPLGVQKDEGGPGLIVKRTEKPQAGFGKPTRRSSEAAQDSRGARQRPLTKSEREQLAADLRLTSPEDEEALDLLDDRLSN